MFIQFLIRIFHIQYDEKSWFVGWKWWITFILSKLQVEIEHKKT
jgi:hypothetical protein